MDAINEVAAAGLGPAAPEFFGEAILEADGSIVPSDAECKQGMDFAYDGQYGYHPLLISLANTAEPLFLFNRSGNRPSQEQADVFLDKAIALCPSGGLPHDPAAGRHQVRPDPASGSLGRSGRHPFHLRVRGPRCAQGQSRRTAGRLVPPSERPPRYQVKTDPAPEARAGPTRDRPRARLREHRACSRRWSRSSTTSRSLARRVIG